MFSAVLIWLRQAARALAALFLFATLLPLVLGLVLGIPTAQVLALISSTVVLQANAAFVGVGMGMHPAAVLVIMTLVEVGSVLAIYFICDAFAMQSARVRNMLRRTEEKMQKVPLLEKYGAVTLIVLPAMPIVGLYSSAVIGWILQWDRGLSLLFITIGWVAVTVFLILVALGFVHVLT
ncbi:small multi-drug export protein [Methanoculleus sp. 7T]|uniref:small multi-drug export protein n=1 Tax=Methanoculleus sp. 7T TaxID=2937282 RepID=UPI0020BF27C8|nr:small multi-drug export protein [Methanoculleus sp. 7T]MCK8518582.1 small multi-drug export protein [Methanoculleus sp. 7T]